MENLLLIPSVNLHLIRALASSVNQVNQLVQQS